MKLQIIGTGGMWHKEASASYLIDDHILIDMPNGSCKNLYTQGVNVEKSESELKYKWVSDDNKYLIATISQDTKKCIMITGMY